MKKFTTILCSIAFAIFGIGLAIFGTDSERLSNAQLANAGNVMHYNIPRYNAIPVFNSQDLPLDLRLGQVNDASDSTGITNSTDSTKIDSLQNRIRFLEKRKQVTKVKWREMPAPPPIVKEKIVKVTDTIKVPIYYLTTQVGNKEGPTGKCISVYEVTQIDEICPEDTISSTMHTTEYDVK